MALELTVQDRVERETASATPWGSVVCLSLLSFLLVGLEFMPVSILTPIARDLNVLEGQAGQAIAVSGFFAVIASLFGASVLARTDRKFVVLGYTALLALSSLLVGFAPNYPVFLLGRALVGIAIGGFWSLSTAILARLVSGSDLPRAIAVLQGGTALAVVVAAPVGAYLGELIGWRGTFLVTAPIGLAALAWQTAALPKMPGQTASSPLANFRLVRNPVFALGMAACGLAFMGQNALSIYLRPFLENVARLDVGPLSLTLLGLGLGGLVGTSLIGSAIRRSLTVTLVGLPAALAVLALLLIAAGPIASVSITLLLIWGFFATPIPVTWGTWLTRVVPNDLEAAGGLQVALIQLSIAGGAFAGGILFDAVSWQSTFMLAAILLTGSAGLAFAASRRV